MARWDLSVATLEDVDIGPVLRWSNLAFQKVLSGVGSASVSVLLEDADRLGLFDRPLKWTIAWNNGTPYSFLTEAVSKQKVNEAQQRTVVFSGRGVASALEWATVLPADYPAHTGRERVYENDPPMWIWLDLLTDAQARGTIANVAPSFTGFNDSDGVAWSTAVDLVVEPGGHLLDWFEHLRQLAVADWQMNADMTLDASQSYGTDRAAAIKFRVAADQASYMEGRNSREIRNAAYFEGKFGIQLAQDLGSQAQWGRREVFAQAGDAESATTVDLMAAQYVTLAREERIQRTVSVLAEWPTRTVFTDYDVGDWVGLQEELEESGPATDSSYRVIAITVKSVDGESAVVELGLQSLLESRMERLTQIGLSGGGSGSVPASQQTPLALPSPVQPTTPSAPTGLSLTTGADVNSSWIDVTWVTVAPVDPDPVVEYEVSYGPTGVGVVGAIRVTEPPVRIEPVTPGVEYTVWVRSISRFGVSSLASTSEVVTALGDTGVPGQVTGLSVAAGIRTLTATWDDRTEADMVNGHGSYDVQIATDVGFTTGLRGERISGTVVSFADLATGTTYYVRVRAVDSSGNVGAWSLTASTTTGQVLNADIFNGAVTSLKVADGAILEAKIATDAVSTTKIQSAAITTAKIANLAVTTALIDTAAVTTAKIANLAVTTALIGDAQITTAKIVNLAVDNAKIAALAVDAAKIADLAVTTAKIANLAVTDAKIQTLTASKLTAGTIAAQTITVGAGGVLRAGRTTSPFHYVLFDENGIRMWKDGSAAFVGGVLSFEANVVTGNVSLTGAITATSMSLTGDLTMSVAGKIKTAAAGERLEMGTTNKSRIDFYSGHASETLAPFLEADVDTSFEAPPFSAGARMVLRISSGLAAQPGADSWIELWSGGRGTSDSSAAVKMMSESYDIDTDGTHGSALNINISDFGFQIQTNGYIEFDNTRIGRHPSHGIGWAWFGHRNMTASGDYALMQNEVGQTLLNTKGGTACQLRVNNAVRIAYGDASVEIWRYIHVEVPTTVAAGASAHARMQIQPRGPTGFVGMSSWVFNHGIAPVLLADSGRGERWVCGNNSIQAHCPIAASGFEVNSTLRVKSNVRTMEKGVRSKVREMRPIRFKREHTQCATCIGKGQLSPAEFIERVHGEKRTAQTPSNLLKAQPCPTCSGNGTPGRINTPTIDANDDKDFLGFAAEELVEIVPEAVVFAPSDSNDVMSAPRPEGIDLMALLTVVAAAVQELDERLDALEAIAPGEKR